MSGAYLLFVTLHVVAALVWLGGMLFFAVAAPVLRRVPDDALRAGLFDALGRRFRAVGWACVAVLLLTGVEQLRLRGWWGSDFWRSAGLLARANAILGLVLVYVAVRLARGG